MPVMSIRLSEKELKLIQGLAREEDKEKSSEARELILEGIKYRMLVGYRQGRVSLGTLTRRLGISLSEAIDLLASLGVPAPITFDDYLQGLGTARKLLSR
jgi:hypothetical protein